MTNQHRTHEPDWLILLVAFAIAATIIGIALSMPAMIGTWR